MAVNTPDSASQVEERMKVDVQREAPDSNPYLKVHWLRSLIAGIARRIFDFYRDLQRTEQRLFPDTAYGDSALKWGNIYIGPKNPSTIAVGKAMVFGNTGGVIASSTVLTSGSSLYTTTSSGTIALHTIPVLSMTRFGTTVIVLTNGDHNLSSYVHVTISGAVQTEYNGTNITIDVTGSDSFAYEVSGSPASPATGSLLLVAKYAIVDVESITTGLSANLDPFTSLLLQSPVVNIFNTLIASRFGITGGTDQETDIDYKNRYLEKIRNPVAHFNDHDIIAKAKEVPGVTRVFVQGSNFNVSSVAISSITRNGSIATVITTTPHSAQSGQVADIAGASLSNYNQDRARILVEDNVTFHYLVSGSPVTPATGTLTASISVPVGQLKIYFLRDGDSGPIPSSPEIDTVKAKVYSILPANTSQNDCSVLAPTAQYIDYNFTSIEPNTPTMKSAIIANIAQFHEENTTVGENVFEVAYRAAIKNTIDISTGEQLRSFVLTAPVGDIAVPTSSIALKGVVTFS
jgi:uncharacterized phage protein gp47/JayE